jgi:hypothetical protein
MMPKTLMLSDTAMVLLREYIEAYAAWWLVTEEHNRRSDPDKKDIDLDCTERHHTISNLREALIDELAYLSIMNDIRLIRHLDWHLTLNQHLMTEMEETLRSRQETHRSAFMQRYDFMRELRQAYQAALSRRRNA